VAESPTPGWEPIDEVNGYSWNGTTSERIWGLGEKANGYVFDGQIPRENLLRARNSRRSCVRAQKADLDWSGERHPGRDATSLAPGAVGLPRWEGCHVAEVGAGGLPRLPRHR